MVLFNLAFVSECNGKVTEDLLASIKKQAVRNNTASNITGLLLTSHGRFMEFLEGDISALTALYARVCADKRHRNVKCILFAPCKERLYPDWALGVYDLDRHVPDASIVEIQQFLSHVKNLSYIDVVRTFDLFSSGMISAQQAAQSTTQALATC